MRKKCDRSWDLLPSTATSAELRPDSEAANRAAEEGRTVRVYRTSTVRVRGFENGFVL